MDSLFVLLGLITILYHVIAFVLMDRGLLFIQTSIDDKIDIIEDNYNIDNEITNIDIIEYLNHTKILDIENTVNVVDLVIS